MKEVLKQKSDIADKYIKEFKEELNFFEKIIISPITKKMKEVLSSDKEIQVDKLWDLEDLWFWRKVLWVRIFDKNLFGSLTDKTFNFLKEKQKEIIAATTSWELDGLYKEVVDWVKTDDYQNWNNWSWGDVPEWDNNSTDADTKAPENDENPINPEDEQVNSEEESSSLLTSATWTWAAWTAYYTGYKTLEKTAEKQWIRASKEWLTTWEIDVKRTKKLMTDVAENFRQTSKNVKLNSFMKWNYNKSAKIFEDAAEALWKNGVWDAFQARSKLWDKIPMSILKKMNISKDISRALDGLSDAQLEGFIKATNKSQYLKNITGKDFPEELVNSLKKAENLSELQWMRRVFRFPSWLSRIAKWMAWMWVVDVLALWFDVWVYMEGMKEADMIAKVNKIRADTKRNQVTTHLVIWVASFVLEAGIIIWAATAWTTIWWPLWTAIGLWIGAFTFVADQLVDELYYDKKLFYEQKRQEYIKKERTDIKQAILQLLMSNNLDMNEGMKEEIKKKWIDTHKDAWEALIYQEELLSNKYPKLQAKINSWKSNEEYESFLKESSPESYEDYVKEKEDMEKTINIRMEYIKPYMIENNSSEYNKMISMVQAGNWIEFIEQVLSDSDVYRYIKTDNENTYIENYKNMGVEEYKEAYRQKLQSENPDGFDILEDLQKNNPVHFYEVCMWALDYYKPNFDNLWENRLEYYSQPEIDAINSNLDFIKKYSEYRNLWRPIEKTLNLQFDFEHIDFNYIDLFCKDISKINQRPTYEKEDLVWREWWYFSHVDAFQSRLNAELQVSGSTGQNILYRIAAEFHWYSWNNEIIELINFYSQASESARWIYYDDEFNVNKESDRSDKFFTIGASTAWGLASWAVIPVLWNILWWFAWLVAWVASVISWSIDKDFKLEDIDNKNMSSDEVFETLFKSWSTYQNLDSPIEAADNELISEYEAKVKKIIEEEIWYRDSKEVYEKKIIDFITQSTKDTDWYVEIPYNLIIEAKKSKIWNVENFMFSYRDWKLFAISNQNNMDELLNFDNSDISIVYEAISPAREELSQEEQALVNKVDLAHDRLESLRSVEWSSVLWWWAHEDELDIPVELERSMSEKWLNRQKVKEDMLYMDPLSSVYFLKNKREQYYNYFEWTYMWMLATISQFEYSNDMDDISYMNQARSRVWRDVVTVVDGKLSIPELNLEDDEKYFLLYYIKNTKDEETDKTVEELLQSENPDDTKKWKWMSKQILISILESETIAFNNKWDIVWIWCNIDPKDEKVTDGKMWYWQEPYKDPKTWQSYWERHRVDVKPNTRSTKVIESRIVGNLKIWAPSIVFTDLELLETSEILTKEQTIREVSKSETNLYLDKNEMVENIISTMKNVDWAGRRWDVKFIPYEDKIEEWKIPWRLESRWVSTEITIYPWEEKELISNFVPWQKYTYNTDYLTIEWLDVKFSNVEDGLRMANWFNHIKWHILKENPNYRKIFIYDDHGIQADINMFWFFWWDTTILKESTIDKYFSKLNSPSDRQKIIRYLNSL